MAVALQLAYVRTFSPVLDDTGEVTHVLGYSQEITELKKTEEALGVAHEKLQIEVAVRRETEEELRRALVEVAALKERLQAENVYLREEIRTEHNFDEIVGTPPGLRNVLEAVATVAPTEANVVVYGETGTGKELVARAVHAHSGRKEKPLIKVNCASVPRELFESEFFGHVKGAFTGAVRDRAGRFELAHEGTLFLDEVGEIPLDMQSKLLRVLQEGEYERIGEERTRQVDVRMIAATNRDLKKEVAEGRFRQDLFYRLNVFPVEVPPLRDRSGDVPLLAKYYLELTARKLGRETPELAPFAIQQLRTYAWPGNVRELQNVVERAAITARGGELRFDLPSDAIREQTPAAHAEAELDVISDAEMQRRVAANLEGALRRTHGRIYGPNGAAALLGPQINDARVTHPPHGTRQGSASDSPRPGAQKRRLRPEPAKRSRLAVNLAAFHHEAHFSQSGNVFGRVALDGHQVRQEAWADATNLILHLEHARVH